MNFLSETLMRLGYNGEIKHTQHQQTHNTLSSILFCSSQLIQNLKQYGLHRKKSLQETFCTDMQSYLIKHYIRGLIDGDGFIAQQSKKIGLCGSQDIVSKTTRKLSKHLNLSTIPKIRQEGTSDLYRVEFTGEN